MIVCDTNLLIYLFLPSVNSELAEEVLQKDNDWQAPLLWRSEFRNVLMQYVNVSKLSVNLAKSAMKRAEDFLSSKEYVMDSDTVIDFALSKKISAYDAEFVALAEYLDIKLVTFDKKVLKNAGKIAMSARKFIA